MNDKSDIQLNLELSWERVRDDLVDGRTFLRHPHELKLTEVNLNEWLKSIKASLDNFSYNPSPVFVCDVPKTNNGIRPGAILKLKDRVIYTALIGECIPNIKAGTIWSENQIDFNNKIAENPNARGWIVDQFEGWENFRIESLKSIEEGIYYVVTTDIAGYYENIDIRVLSSDLLQLGVSQKIVKMLATCLNKWAQIQGRGIPQGYSASDILGKVYLNVVDQAMVNKGYKYYRYSDDIRIFCRNEKEAKEALVELIVLLRRRGLSLQTSKTFTLKADDARKLFEGKITALKNVLKKYIAEVKILTKLDNPYMTISQADKALSKENDEDSLPIESIAEAYKAYYTDSDGTDFDKSFFHFLLRRLGNSKNDFALEHCMKLLQIHPEETSFILKYFSQLRGIDKISKDLIDLLISEIIPYPYQESQILEWLDKEIQEINPELLDLVRKNLVNNNKPYYIHTISRIILGKYGSAADLENIESSYSTANNDLTKCEIIFALERMETSRRNAFYSRVEGDSFLIRKSVSMVKGGS